MTPTGRRALLVGTASPDRASFFEVSLIHPQNGLQSFFNSRITQKMTEILISFVLNLLKIDSLDVRFAQMAYERISGFLETSCVASSPTFREVVERFYTKCTENHNTSLFEWVYSSFTENQGPARFSPIYSLGILSFIQHMERHVTDKYLDRLSEDNIQSTAVIIRTTLISICERTPVSPNSKIFNIVQYAEWLVKIGRSSSLSVETMVSLIARLALSEDSGGERELTVVKNLLLTMTVMPPSKRDEIMRDIQDLCRHKCIKEMSEESAGKNPLEKPANLSLTQVTVLYDVFGEIGYFSTPGGRVSLSKLEDITDSDGLEPLISHVWRISYFKSPVIDSSVAFIRSAFEILLNSDEPCFGDSVSSRKIFDHVRELDRVSGGVIAAMSLTVLNFVLQGNSRSPETGGSRYEMLQDRATDMLFNGYFMLPLFTADSDPTVIAEVTQLVVLRGSKALIERFDNAMRRHDTATNSLKIYLNTENATLALIVGSSNLDGDLSLKWSQWRQSCLVQFLGSDLDLRVSFLSGTVDSIQTVRYQIPDPQPIQPIELPEVLEVRPPENGLNWREGGMAPRARRAVARRALNHEERLRLNIQRLSARRLGVPLEVVQRMIAEYNSPTVLSTTISNERSSSGISHPRIDSVSFGEALIIEIEKRLSRLGEKRVSSQQDEPSDSDKENEISLRRYGDVVLALAVYHSKDHETFVLNRLLKTSLHLVGNLTFGELLRSIDRLNWVDLSTLKVRLIDHVNHDPRIYLTQVIDCFIRFSTTLSTFLGLPVPFAKFIQFYFDKLSIDGRNFIRNHPKPGDTSTLTDFREFGKSHVVTSEWITEETELNSPACSTCSVILTSGIFVDSRDNFGIFYCKSCADVYTQSGGVKFFSLMSCAICMSDNLDLQMSFLGCLHAYCTECIAELTSHQTRACPLCKIKIEQSSIKRENVEISTIIGEMERRWKTAT